MLAQIEACLNSRPLTPLPEASGGLDVLAPEHFYIGRPISYIVARPARFLSVFHSLAPVDFVSNAYSTLLASLVFRLLEQSSEVFQMAYTYARSRNWRYCVR